MNVKNSLDPKQGEYITECLQRHALKFIEDNKEKPFFLYLPLYSVHEPWKGNVSLMKKYKERFPDEPIKVAYAAMTEGVDVLVGSLRKKIADCGLTDKTLIIFTSDNGGAFKETCKDLRDHKGFIYEGGIKVPLIITGPSVVKGETATLVNQIDFLPTLVELCGLRSVETDGLSLMPLLNGSGPLPERALFWHYPHCWPLVSFLL